MRKVMIGIAAGAIVLSLVGAAIAEDKQPQTKCPVMGGDINKEVYVDFQGQRIYFCCGACPDKFKADPEKYMEKFEKEGVLLESVQENCPVMGGKIDKGVFVDYKGRRVYFCCPGCPEKFRAEPEKYLKKLETKSEIKDDTKAGEHEGHSGHGGHKMKMKGCGGCG
ncbi:MAG: YHS domain-containing protein [Planctomycetota bacterium]